MTDKERIEKFLITLKHLDNCMTYLRDVKTIEEMNRGIDTIKETIQGVIDSNSDQIDIETLWT